MKTALYDISGKKKGDVELPAVFSRKIREDIAKKCFETSKFIQPYSHDSEAGRKHSASGTISHKRHDWKGHYGKGISRFPRKTMWRRGTQFFWIGAEASGARGGRRVHGPLGIGKEKKMNKREMKIGLDSAFAATGNEKMILGRYQSLEKLHVHFPLIIESKLEKAKTKEFKAFLKTLLGDSWNIAMKNKSVRKGKGKSRGRKYKSNAGILLVTGKDEIVRMKGIDVKKIGDVSVSDLYPLGRIAIYTEKALEALK